MQSQRQIEYLQEYERLKHIEIIPGDYENISGIKFQILSVDKELETAKVKTVKSGVLNTRTLHWCRKNLRSAE
jgi:hypothetical protein